MTGVIMDAVLMLLLVAAIGYGIRLERRLRTLREGQAAFAGAVTELNAAAGRAEAALASLRASGQETDLLHDRIVKARALRQELEAMLERAPRREAAPSRPAEAPASRPAASAPVDDAEIERARRMAILAERLATEAGETPRAEPRAPGRENVAAIFQALTANQAAKQSLNRARLTLDQDLFAA